MVDLVASNPFVREQAKYVAKPIAKPIAWKEASVVRHYKLMLDEIAISNAIAVTCRSS